VSQSDAENSTNECNHTNMNANYQSLPIINIIWLSYTLRCLINRLVDYIRASDGLPTDISKLQIRQI